jgi:hypothetical protein
MIIMGPCQPSISAACRTIAAGHDRLSLTLPGPWGHPPTPDPQALVGVASPSFSHSLSVSSRRANSPDWSQVWRTYRAMPLLSLVVADLGPRTGDDVEE